MAVRQTKGRDAITAHSAWNRFDCPAVDLRNLVFSRNQVSVRREMGQSQPASPEKTRGQPASDSPRGELSPRLRALRRSAPGGGIPRKPRAYRADLFGSHRNHQGQLTADSIAGKYAAH